MITPLGTEAGSGIETEIVYPDAVRGQCVWCGHNLVYWAPGSPPGDCETDWAGLYDPANVWRNYALIDYPLDYGQYCPSAPAHPLGQYSIHQLVKNVQTP